MLPIIISPERKKLLNDNLMLFFTGFTRMSSEIQKENRLNDESKTGKLLDMLSLVDEAEAILTDKYTK